MKSSRIHWASILVLGSFAILTTGNTGFSQTTKSDSAQDLLRGTKKRTLEAQVADKQTEVARLNEDLSKARKESDEVQNSINATGVTMSDTTASLQKQTAERARLTQALEVVNLRIEAEKLTLDGLKKLSEAQSKAVTVLASRIEETESRLNLGTLELKMKTEELLWEDGAFVASEETKKLQGAATELRRKLAAMEKTMSAARLAAREAMASATLKLQTADAATQKAKKRAEELDLADTGKVPSANADENVPKATQAK